MLKSENIAPIHVVQSLSPDSIMLGEELMKKQGIPKAQHISLQFGIYKQTVKVLPSLKKRGLTMHSRLAQQLAIPLIKGELKLALHYDSEQALLKLGPLMAVMINKETPEDPDQPFGSISSFCTELAEACAMHGAFVYFFTPEAIGAHASLISGWVRDGDWRKLILPLPEVIYNRLPSRKAENQAHVRKLIRETARLHNIFIFNERFLDKHEVFEILSGNSAISSYLPQSQLLSNYEQLQQMISQHPVLYLKPVQGSMGRGIYRLTTLPDNSYGLERAKSNVQGVSKFSSLKRLYNAIKPRLAKQKYQLQQGISVIQVGRKPVDFRALVQKNGQGEWSITSIVARTAGDDQFVANLARGGTIESVLATLPKTNLLQHISYESIYESLRTTALEIALAIDEQLDEHFAELGVDLAVDIQGKIWLIEVNSKPSKVDKTTLSRKIRPSVRVLLAYTKHLTGFQEGRRSHGQSKAGHRRREN